MGHSDLYDQQRHRDGEYAIAEGLDPARIVVAVGWFAAFWVHARAPLLLGLRAVVCYSREAKRNRVASVCSHPAWSRSSCRRRSRNYRHLSWTLAIWERKG